MDKINCSVVIDLLPMYMENLTSEQTVELINDHLNICENCQKVRDELLAENKSNANTNSEIDKKLAKNLSKVLLSLTIRTLIMVIISFAAAFAYFYFSRNFMLQKFLPVLIAGAIGYFTSRKYWIAALGGIVGLIIFVIPGFSQTDSLAAIFLQLAEVFFLFSSGYAVVRLIIKIRENYIKLKDTMFVIICIIVSLFLIISGYIEFSANALIADNYVEKNYRNFDYKRVSGEFSSVYDYYFFKYRSIEGNDLGISTNGNYVYSDSRKPRG